MKSYDERAKDILERRDEQIVKTAALKRRFIPLIAIILVVTTVFAGVFIAAKMSGVPTPVDVDTAAVNGNTGTEHGGDETVKTEYNDGVIGERKSDDNDYAPGYDDGLSRSDSMIKGSIGGYPEAEHYAPSPSESPDYAAEWEYAGDNPVEGITAGMLSAGEWKDLDAFAEWKNRFQSGEWYNIAKSRSLFATDLVTVKVTDGENVCFNCPVSLTEGEKVVSTARTDINGVAYLFYNITGGSSKPDGVKVGGKTVALEGKTELTVDGSGIAAKKLDLMLMIDTTGSMGDEISYLKAELTDMVRRISLEDATFSIRVSVNFYRDEGDDYVVKFYDFREDINECLKQLEAEYAYGGGDYPEAVHTALENAVTGHQWRDDAVKICFFVLDAPPHTETVIQGINANIAASLTKAAEHGIRIIPVASSGVDLETEILLRSFAAITGGTYIFITNDSGIGGGHKEAEVGEHAVEPLNECMIRVVCEYCGIYHGEKIPYTAPYHQ